MSFSHIVACTSKLVIGNDGRIPWHIKEDLQRFKQLTQHHTVIMGRKTFESIGRPLPTRRNIIISRNPSTIPGVELVSDISSALELCSPDEESFIIGGAEIYRQTLDSIDRIYLTLVDSDYSGDTYYPEIPFDVTIEKIEDHGKYSFINLVRSDVSRKNLHGHSEFKVTQEGLTTYSS